jgi:hypothetical protein
MGRLPDFKQLALAAHSRLGIDGARRLLDAGRAWDLAPTLRAGGAVIFPHAGIETCGHLIAAAVHAALDAGANQVLVIGVLHALTAELEAARGRVAAGGDPGSEPSWGIQGPGLERREDWRHEFSLDHFLFLWGEETRHRGVGGPELILRYPYLAGERPERLPGIDELEQLARDAVIVATADPFHHGVGYRDPPERALLPEHGGLDLARHKIAKGFALLGTGSYREYNQHCVDNKSDARDVGQAVRHLMGPFTATIHELVAEDTSAAYGAAPPTWVAGGLIELRPADASR